MSELRMMKGRRSGFTLIELLAVLGILVLLGGVAVVAYTRIAEGGKVKAAHALVNSTTDAVKLYFSVMKEYPSDEQGLAALITPPADDEAKLARWNEGSQGQGFLEKRELPNDPWDMPLNYRTTTDSTSGAVIGFHVYSCGPNKADDQGGEDDIPKWSDQTQG